jgi:hypothetical protein
MSAGVPYGLTDPMRFKSDTRRTGQGHVSGPDVRRISVGLGVYRSDASQIFGRATICGTALAHHAKIVGCTSRLEFDSTYQRLIIEKGTVTGCHLRNGSRCN